MHVTKKILGITCAVAALVSVSACGSSSGGKTADGKKEVSLQTWNLKNDTYTPYFNDLIAAFEKENPDV